jgi:hypothetical protein
MPPKLINWYIHQNDICGDRMLAGFYSFVRFPISSFSNEVITTQTGLKFVIRLESHDSYWKTDTMRKKLINITTAA